MRNEWVWAIAICAIPFLAFGTFELASLLRRRRFEAVARRPKARNLSGG
jgi:hypothetical protein